MAVRPASGRAGRLRRALREGTRRHIAPLRLALCAAAALLGSTLGGSLEGFLNVRLGFNCAPGWRWPASHAAAPRGCRTRRHQSKSGLNWKLLTQEEKPGTAKFSKDQLRDLMEMFELVDTDRSGFIDAGDIGEVLGKFGLRSSGKLGQDVFAGFDLDGDGVVEQDEFLKALEAKVKCVVSDEDDLVRAVRLISGTYSWTPLLFYDENDRTGSYEKLTWENIDRTTKELQRLMSPEDLALIINEGVKRAMPIPLLPKEVLSLDENATESLAARAMRPFLARLRPAYATGRRLSLERVPFFGGALVWGRRMVAELSVALLCWRPTAYLVTLLLSMPAVVWLLTPVLSESYLLTVLRHRNAHKAVATFLRLDSAPKGVAQLLVHHKALSKMCKAPDTQDRIVRIITEPGIGPFLGGFLTQSDPRMLARFLRHRVTADMIGSVVRTSDPAQAAALVFREKGPVVEQLVKVCFQPGMDFWAMRLVRCEGMDAWIGAFLLDPRGAVFARRVLLSPGFLDWVVGFLEKEANKAFVLRLLQQPGVCRFVTWLNRDVSMRQWFAEIATRDVAMLFVTDMLVEPGLDRFIVGLLLRRGNDEALRAMLEHWVRGGATSMRGVAISFASTPAAAQALARVIVSPGFLDRFVIQRLLLQPGLAEVVVEACLLVGFRELSQTVLPLAMTTAAVVFTLAAISTRTGMEADLPAALEVSLEALPSAETIMGIIALILG